LCGLHAVEGWCMRRASGGTAVVYVRVLIVVEIGHGFEPQLLHLFLTFYDDLIKWADGLARHSQQVGLTGARVVARGRLARAGPSFDHI
jgi:hypothetical protein